MCSSFSRGWVGGGGSPGESDPFELQGGRDWAIARYPHISRDRNIKGGMRFSKVGWEVLTEFPLDKATRVRRVGS